MAKTYRDDRKFKTEFSGSWAEVELAGKHDAAEFGVVADWCEENGFDIPSKLLREVQATIKYEEPRRAYGWCGGYHCNLAHFYAPDRLVSPLCGQRIQHQWSDYRWYPQEPACQRCLKRLRENRAKEFPAALAAIERLLAERAGRK